MRGELDGSADPGHVGSVDAVAAPRSSRPDRLLIAGAVVAVVGFAIAFWTLYDSGGDFGQIDYRIYAGSAGGYPYGRSIYEYVHPEFHLSATYPPIGILLFVPLSFLNTRVAEAIWLLANIGCIVLILWLVCTHLLHLTNERRRLVCLIGPSLAIPTTLMWRDLQLGQINLFIWLAIIYDVILIRRRSRYGGLLIGLVSAVKLTPLIFILFLVVVREWRPATKAIAVFIGSNALAWAIAPADSHLYWTKLIFETGRIGDVADRHNNSLRFVAGNLPIGERAQVGLWLVAAVVAVVVGLWQASRSWRAGHVLHAVLLVGCVQALVSPISWQHHLIFLLLGLLLLPMPRAPRARWKEVAVLGVAWLFLLDPVAFGVNRVTAALRCLVMALIVAGLVLRPTSWLQDEAAGQPEDQPDDEGGRVWRPVPRSSSLNSHSRAGEPAPRRFSASK